MLSAPIAPAQEVQSHRPFCLKVTRLPTDCTLHELEELFAKDLGVVKVDLKFASIPNTSNKNRRQKVPYGLIEFQSAAAASMAMKKFEGESFRGQALE